MDALERVLCLSLFSCLLVSVLSTVSLLYLAAVVYIPSHR